MIGHAPRCDRANCRRPSCAYVGCLEFLTGVDKLDVVFLPPPESESERHPTASPWHRVQRPELPAGWGRSIGPELVALATDSEARYRPPGGEWRRRGCDDLEASCRTANAGLRLLGVLASDAVIRSSPS